MKKHVSLLVFALVSLTATAYADREHEVGNGDGGTERARCVDVATGSVLWVLSDDGAIEFRGMPADDQVSAEIQDGKYACPGGQVILAGYSN